MTATPSAAEKAAAWAKEHGDYGSRNFAKRAWLAGHAAGEQAGIEKELARVCVWGHIHNDRVGHHWIASCGDSRPGELQPPFNFCPFCGGRIEVKP